MYKVAQGERKNTAAATNNPKFIKFIVFMSETMLVHLDDKKRKEIWMYSVVSSIESATDYRACCGIYPDIDASACVVLKEHVPN